MASVQINAMIAHRYRELSRKLQLDRL